MRAEDVDYLGRLARIQLSPEEIKHFTSQLDGILAHVEKLKSAQVREVPSTAHVLKSKAVIRPDKQTDCLSNDQALANAPSKEGPYFKVPKIIDAV